MSLNERLEELSKLPIFQFLDEIRDAFQGHGRVVIAAPTGSGNGDEKAWEMAAREVGRIAREVGARSWSQLLPHLPEAEELARRIQTERR